MKGHYRARATKLVAHGMPWLGLGIGLYVTSLYNYLLFHTLAELFSIVVASAIFILAWNTRQFAENHYLIFIGIGYLFIAILDLIHTLSYRGMNIFAGFDANLPTQLWIAARYFQASVLLIAPQFTWRVIPVRGTVVLGGFVTLALLITIFARVFPDCYIEGVGLTPFKIISEYIISAMLIGASVQLYRQRTEFDARVFRLLVSSILLTIGSELAFTFYVDVYDFSNQVGHFFKIAAFYLVYKAIVETGLKQPFELMFRRLKQNEHTLRHLSTHDALTGLYNRLYFEEELARLEPSRQFPVSIVVSDLDDLKRVNDTQGHAAGDALLKHAARILKQAFRAEDIVARIGGDEFAVILPNADAEVARYAIDRIHSASLENPLPPPSPPLTMSVGMCTADKGDSLYNTLKTADMEMYKNKAAKRNQRERKVDVK